MPSGSETSLSVRIFPKKKKLSPESLEGFLHTPHFPGSETLQPRGSSVHFQEASLSGHGTKLHI